MIIAPYDNLSSGSFSGSVAWEDIKGRPDLSTISSMKAIQITLLSSLWEDHEQTVKVEGILADELPQWIVVSPKKSDEDVYFSANVLCVSQEDDALVFHADSIPEQDISAIVRIFGAAEIKEGFSGTFAWWSPKMTSNNNPLPYVSSASSTVNENVYEAFRAFDGDGTTMWCTPYSIDDEQWIKFDFGSRTPVSGIKLSPADPPTQLPKSFRLLGSNDDQTWDMIYESNGEEYPSDPKIGDSREYLFEPKNYRYYKLEMKLNGNYSGVNIVRIAEMEFYKLEETT